MEDDKLTKPLQTGFGIIPAMPKSLSASEVCIIAVDDGCHYAKPTSVCMPHQLYLEKLEKLLEEGDVFIYPASRAFRVKKEGKKVWIE